MSILSLNICFVNMFQSFDLVFLIALTVLALVELPGWPLFMKQALSWLPGPAVLMQVWQSG